MSVLNFKRLIKRFYNKISIFALVAGPGLVVMLADTDVGSLITAAQSGAVWQYKLLWVQLLLIPILYICQELTIRLGIITKCGQGELIKKYFGKFWGYTSMSILVICCGGAIISEMSGIAGVGLLFGVPIWISMLMTAVFLVWLVWTRSYYSVERIALAIGAFALVYLFIACYIHPSINEIYHGLTNLPFHNSNYLYLFAANIGAVIMPWMIFYQQSAIVDKKLKLQHMNITRLETLIGAILTQLIMISVLIVAAATLGKANQGVPLQNVQQISDAITPFLGKNIGRILFGLGMIGAALIATIVVSLTAAWGIGEITGYKRSLSDHPKKAPWFYGIYLLIVASGAILVISGMHLIKLNIAIEVMNSLLLPIVLSFLFLLARKALPEQYRLKGFYALLVGIILFITSAIGLIAGIWGIFA